MQGSSPETPSEGLTACDLIIKQVGEKAQSPGEEGTSAALLVPASSLLFPLVIHDLALVL